MSINDKLDEIEARLEAATEGPWTASGCYVETVPPFDLHRFDAMSLTVARCEQDDTDAALIAHARTDVPWLVEQVKVRDKALDAVLALHVPSECPPESPYCVGCWNAGGYDGAPLYPCQTVRAITEVLDGAA